MLVARSVEATLAKSNIKTSTLALTRKLQNAHGRETVFIRVPAQQVVIHLGLPSPGFKRYEVK